VFDVVLKKTPSRTHRHFRVHHGPGQYRRLPDAQRFDAPILGLPGEDGAPNAGLRDFADMARNSSTLFGLSDDSFERIGAEAEPSLREVLRG